MVLFVVSSVKIFSLFKQERDEFFSNTQTKIFKRNVAWEYKEEESIPLREDEDALVEVVFVTFVLPQFSFFLAPFREEEEEEEHTFGGR